LKTLTILPDDELVIGDIIEHLREANDADERVEAGQPPKKRKYES